MFKKISTSLFLLIYFSVSTVLFAEEVVLELVSEPPPVVETVVEPVVKDIPEEILSGTPFFEEVVSPMVSGDAAEEVVIDTSVPEETPTAESTVIDTPSETQGENVIETIPTEIQDPLLSAPADGGDILDAILGEETTEIVSEIPDTEEVLETEPVQVEENSIFTPPGPEPEPWQPVVREDPTTESNTAVGDTQTQSDPVFLAENSIFVRRMIENVVVDPTAKHSCKVDVFRTDISDTTTSTLLVKFYGISMVAAYDAEIGSLPNGIDVRFAKNSDYIYDFRGKETTLELVVNNQDNSLTGDFTIPIIYTHKGKKDSTVICQLNIVNDEEENIQPVLAPIVEPVVETVEPEVNPAQEFIEDILNTIVPELEVTPVFDVQSPVTVEEILDILVPDIPPIAPPVELPPAIIPEPEEGPIDPTTESIPLEPETNMVAPIIVEPEVANPVTVEPITVLDPIVETVAPSVETPPVVESTPILSSDVSST